MYNKKRSRGTTRDANKRCDEESNKKAGSGFKKQAVATEIVCPPAAGNKIAQLSAALPSRSIKCGQRPKSSDEGSDEDSCTANSALASRSSESEHVIESDNQANYKTDESLSSRTSEKEKLKQNDIMKRMEANRLRAKTARSKKKVMIEEMNSKIYGLSMENERLKNQNRTQQTEIEFLRNAVGLLPMPNSQNQVRLPNFNCDLRPSGRRNCVNKVIGIIMSIPLKFKYVLTTCSSSSILYQVYHHCKSFHIIFHRRENLYSIATTVLQCHRISRPHLTQCLQHHPTHHLQQHWQSIILVLLVHYQLLPHEPIPLNSIFRFSRAKAHTNR